LALKSGHERGILMVRCSSLPRSSPYKISLSPAESAELHRRAGKYTLPYFQVQRAKMILYAADGMPNDKIAACLDTRREVVSLWRKRFFTDRLAGLEEHARPGRPRTFSPRSRRSG
jgi:Winged helix-turn helix